MLDYLPGDSRHVRWFPRKHIFIGLEESNELEFLVRREICLDISGLIGIALVDDNWLSGRVPFYDFLRLRCIIGLVCDLSPSLIGGLITDEVEFLRQEHWEH